MKTIKLFGLGLLVLLGACKKDDATGPNASPQPSPYYVNMTDAPGPYLAVNIDLQAVEIVGNGGTVMLNTTPGIYNLLNFSAGLDTLIATGSLSMTQVQQIRLILGPNNTIVTSDGVSHPLATPSAQQSGLKLQVHQVLQPGVAYSVLLDFDAAQSIVDQGNGSYSLKPVIRTVEVALSGSIKGHLSQPGVFASVTAISGASSYSAFANANGDFILTGLPPGIYTVAVTPASPYSPVTISNVVVTTGAATNVGLITI